MSATEVVGFGGTDEHEGAGVEGATGRGHVTGAYIQVVVDLADLVVHSADDVRVVCAIVKVHGILAVLADSGWTDVRFHLPGEEDLAASADFLLKMLMPRPPSSNSGLNALPSHSVFRVGTPAGNM